MLIYRVEDFYLENAGYKNRQGKGRETGLKCLDHRIGDVYCYFNDDKDRPLLWNDGIDKSMLLPFHYFGFKSLSDFNAWFTLEQRYAGALCGGLLSLYNIDAYHVIHARKQLIFDHRNATKVVSLPMDYYDGVSVPMDEFWDDWKLELSLYTTEEYMKFYEEMTGISIDHLIY